MLFLGDISSSLPKRTFVSFFFLSSCEITFNDVKHDLQFLPGVSLSSTHQFHLHQPKLETLHAEIWRAVYFSLNRGRCGSVMFASVLCWWGAPCRGTSAPRQWWVLPSCDTQPAGCWSGLNLLFLYYIIGFHSNVSLPAVCHFHWLSACVCWELAGSSSSLSKQAKSDSV